MKKGLSVLLIAAALFGFYGGAINLNDVLACKDYWEIKGEESTADMNKLEDGLNQLKENEQAYLDGVDALADGEQALADGEVALAQGRRTLAKGEADYAAAPGKLKKGKKDLSDITRLINGLNKANKSFNDYSVGDDGKKGPSWKKGFEAKASKADFSDAGLKQAKGVIESTVKIKANDVALIETVAKVEPGTILKQINAASKSGQEYKEFDKAMQNASKTFGSAIATLKAFSALAKSKASDLGGAASQIAAAPDSAKNLNAAQMKGAMSKMEAGVKQATAAMGGIDIKGMSEDELKALVAQVPALKDTITSYIGLKKLLAGRSEILSQLNSFMGQAGAYLPMIEKLNADAYKAIMADVNTLTKTDASNAAFAAALSNTPSGSNPVPGLAQCLRGIAEVLDEKIQEAQSSRDSFDAWDAGYKQLKAGQEQLADQDEGLPYAFQQMRSNSTLRKALKKSVPGAYAKLAKYTGNRLAADDMDDFDDDMHEITSMLKKIMPVLRKVKADGQKKYNQGLKDYKAAPGKLAAGRAQLAEGERTLIDGRQQLADGKAKLGEYEDGEQQVRDGLATLMGTAPDGGLASILERRNGDDDFDNGDGHLELDEGLDAVEVGRGYQSDSGELITKELTNRAVGTGLGLGAGALALLAGFLSFIKKNKAAGISALASAVAGAVAIGVGMKAGMEFSNIAGSHVASLPQVAVGILAAVATVHAIVHFTAKKDA